MSKPGDTLSIIEVAYRPAETREAWATQVATAFQVVVKGAPCAALLYDATHARRVEIDWSWFDGFPAAAVAALDMPVPDDAGTALTSLYRTTVFARTREDFVPIEPRLRALLDGAGRDFGFVNATDPTFQGMACVIPAPRNGFSIRSRYVWQRVAAHVAAGLRLQRTLTALHRGAAPLDTAEAVLSPTGRVEHAVGSAKRLASRRGLQDALVRIAAARRVRHDEPERAADLWTGLFAGRWSLVEHFDRDGRHYFLAHRNEPSLGATRALSRRERQVFTYSAMGHSNKLIAYSLGLSLSTVAAHLARARRKLGNVGLDALQSLAPVPGASEP
jgi:DNA-binding CsgD family transcriptional regulator